MEVVSGIFDSKTQTFTRQTAWRSPVVALGNFDGVHVGHQAILKAAVAAAKMLKGVSMCLTFEPHPLRFLSQGQEPKMVHTTAQKVKAIADLGIDVLMVQTFDRPFSQLEADMFMQRYLAESLAVRGVRIGSRFHFGFSRQGNETVLKRFCELQHIDFLALPECRVDGESVSSSKIRTLLQQGNIAKANAWLGHGYALTGRVIPGQGRGRTLGFPTANLFPENDTLIPFGVYACQVCSTDDSQVLRPAVCNFGVRPTFENGPVKPQLEVHLLDFKGDLYQKSLQVSLRTWLRPEKTFSRPEDLQKQIVNDIHDARSYFK